MFPPELPSDTGVASFVSWLVGSLVTPAVFSRTSLVALEDELPTVPTTHVPVVAVIVAGAVYVTVQCVKLEVPRVQFVVPSEPCPPLEPLAVFDSA